MLWIKWDREDVNDLRCMINPNYVEEEHASPSPYQQIHAIFKNPGNDVAYENAELYYNDDRRWGPLGNGDPPLKVNTYKGHVWNVIVDGKIVKSWTMSEDDGVEQEFTL